MAGLPAPALAHGLATGRAPGRPASVDVCTGGHRASLPTQAALRPAREALTLHAPSQALPTFRRLHAHVTTSSHFLEVSLPTQDLGFVYVTSIYLHDKQEAGTLVVSIWGMKRLRVSTPKTRSMIQNSDPTRSMLQTTLLRFSPLSHC